MHVLRTLRCLRAKALRKGLHCFLFDLPSSSMALVQTYVYCTSENVSLSRRLLTGARDETRNTELENMYQTG